jgi:hypothetical protein
MSFSSEDYFSETYSYLFLSIQKQGDMYLKKDLALYSG